MCNGAMKRCDGFLQNCAKRSLRVAKKHSDAVMRCVSDWCDVAQRTLFSYSRAGCGVVECGVSRGDFRRHIPLLHPSRTSIAFLSNDNNNVPKKYTNYLDSN